VARCSTGELASVLHGGPYVLNVPAIELVPARPRQASAALEKDGWIAALLDETELDDQRVAHLAPRGQAEIVLIARPAATGGYRDLARDATELPGVALPVVSVRDLLRIAERSREDVDRDRRLEQRTMLDLEDPRNPPDLTLFAG